MTQWRRPRTTVLAFGAARERAEHRAAQDFALLAPRLKYDAPSSTRAARPLSTAALKAGIRCMSDSMTLRMLMDIMFSRCCKL